MHKQLIIDTCLQYGLSLQEAAYVLATADWETNHTFEPVKEAYWIKNAEAWRKKNLRYYPWYGRGFVQLTWEYNYRKAGKELGVDLISNPDLAMDPKIAAKILVVGMKKGWFTGKNLDDSIDNVDESDTEDFKEYVNARRVVNGKDKAETIAKAALLFEEELKKNRYGLQPPRMPQVGQDTSGEGVGTTNLLLRLLRLLWAVFRNWADRRNHA